MVASAKIDRWLSSSGIPKNNIAQVQQTVMTNVQVIATGAGTGNYDLYWYPVSQLTCTMKPYDLRSKILVMLDIHMGTTYWEIQGRIKRNGLPIGLGNKAGSRIPCTFADNNYEIAGGTTYSQYSVYKSSVILLDDPLLSNDQSSAEYTVWLNPYSSNTLYVNKPAYENNDSDYWGAPISTLTLMEITQ